MVFQVTFPRHVSHMLDLLLWAALTQANASSMHDCTAVQQSHVWLACACSGTKMAVTYPEPECKARKPGSDVVSCMQWRVLCMGPVLRDLTIRHDMGRNQPHGEVLCLAVQFPERHFLGNTLAEACPHALHRVQRPLQLHSSCSAFMHGRSGGLMLV